ncbi:MAG: OmpA family protein [Gemmatimonadales bacterium]
MRKVMKIGVLLPVAVLLVSGCATKGFVRDMFAKKDVEVDQRFVKVEAQVVKVEGQVEGVNTEVKGVTTQVKSLEGAVADARSRADAAMTKAEGVDTRLTRLWSNRYNQKTADTLEVYFGFDKAELTDGAQTALLGVIKELQGNPTLVVELGGYTDPKGTLDYNYGLSQRRVESVRRFLVEKGVPLSRVQAVGLGPITAKETPDEKKRRVTVKMMVDQD